MPSEEDVRVGAYAALGHFRKRLLSGEALTSQECVLLSELLSAVEEHMENMWELFKEGEK